MLRMVLVGELFVALWLLAVSGPAMATIPVSAGGGAAPGGGPGPADSGAGSVTQPETNDDDGGGNQGPSPAELHAAEQLCRDAEAAVERAGLNFEEASRESDPARLRAARAAYQRALSSRQRAEQALAGLNAAADRKQEAMSNAAQVVRRLTGEGRSATAGDPVMVNSGRFIHPVTEFSYEYFGVKVSLSRIYDAGIHSRGAFGPQWVSSMDTRIIRGVPVGARAYAEAARVFRAEISAAEAVLSAEVAAVWGDSEAIESALLAAEASTGRLRELLAASEDARNDAGRAVQAALQVHRTDLASRATRAATQCSRLCTDIRDSVSAAERYYNELRKIKSSCAFLKRAQERAGAAVRAAEETLDVSTAHRRLNGRVRVYADDAALSAAGADTVTFIDGRGVPHLYRTSRQPDATGTALLGDGIPNTYREGAEFFPVAKGCGTSLVRDADQPQISAVQDRISLLSDGTFRRAHDGTVWSYSQYGELSEVTDQNGNSIRCVRDTMGRLISLRDQSGRATGFLWKDRHLVRLVDPSGAAVRFSYDASGRLESATGRAGHTVTYGYHDGQLNRITKPDGSQRVVHSALDPAGRLTVTVTDEEGNGERFVHDAVHHRFTYVNAEGAQSIYSYNEQGCVTSISYPDGSSKSFDYDGAGYLLRHTNEIGARTSYRYDRSRRLIACSDPAGYTRRWEYGSGVSPAHITRFTDRKGNQTRFRYDARGNLIEVRHADGARELFMRGNQGELLERIDPEGRRFKFSYSQRGYVEEVTLPGPGRVRIQRDAMGRMTSYSDADGVMQRYSWTPDGLLAVMTDADGNRTTYHYNQRRDLDEVQGPGGVRTVYQYDARHLLTERVDAAGGVTRWTRRADGKVSSRHTPSGRVFRYTYDARGMPSAVVLEGGPVSHRLTYDVAGRLVSYMDPGGNRTRFTYGPRALLRLITHGDGTEERFAYDACGNLVRHEDETGGVSRWSYDSRNRVLSATDPSGGVTGYAYDRAGRVISVTDPCRAVTRFGYGNGEKPVEKRDAGGYLWNYRWTPAGRLSLVRDPEGGITRYEYDARGMCERITDPLGGVRTASYDPRGLVTSVTGPRGARTALSRDGRGQILCVTDPYGNNTCYEYDAAGRPVKAIDPTGAVWEQDYDEASRRVIIHDPTGAESRRTYDVCGRLATVVDAEGRETTYGYNRRGLLSSVTDAAGARRQWSYDGAGRVSAETDPEGRIHRYGYDRAGRLVEEVDRLGSRATYEYDAAGRLTRRRDFDGRETTCSYDTRGNLVSVTTGTEAVSRFCFDSRGWLTAADNANARYRYDYDAAGNIVRQRELAGGSDLRFEYDACGNRTRISDPAGGRQVTFSYGEMGELTRLILPGREVTTFSYDQLLRQRSVTRSNGVETHTGYDACGRVAGVVHRTAGNSGRAGAVLGTAYVYAADGRRIGAVDQDGKKTVYEYDEAGRLASVRYPLSRGKPEADRAMMARLEMRDVSSALDAPGKGGTLPRGSRLISISPQVEDALNYAAAALFGSRKPQPGRSLEAWTERFSYDARGNMVRRESPWGVVSAAYDAENRITALGGLRYRYDASGNPLAIEGAATQIAFTQKTPALMTRVDSRGDRRVVESSFTYDAFGRRASATHEEHGIRTEIKHVTRVTYDIFSLDPVLKEVTGTGSGPATFSGGKAQQTPPARFHSNAPSRTPGSRGTDARLLPSSGRSLQLQVNGRLFASTGAAGSRYFGHDGTGSLTCSFDIHGELQSGWGYDALGAPLAPGEGGSGELFMFAGAHYDPSTHLYRVGYRDYDPAAGRFLTADPARVGGNWYLYGGGDAVNWFEETGFAPRNLSEEQRNRYKAALTVWASNDDRIPRYAPESGDAWRAGEQWDCADVATYLAAISMAAANNGPSILPDLADLAGGPLEDIRNINSGAFQSENLGNISFYRTRDGTIDRAWNSPHVEVGTIGVFDNHIITVTDVLRDSMGNVTNIQTIQGHFRGDVDRVPIVSQGDLDSYKGTFVGWGEIGRNSAGSQGKRTNE